MKANYRVDSRINRTNWKYILVANYHSLNELVHLYTDFDYTSRSYTGRWRIKKC